MACFCLICFVGLFLCISQVVKGGSRPYNYFSEDIPDQMQEPKLGDTVNLFCNDTDGPQTVIGWVADGIDVGSRQGLDINGNTLTISSFSAEYEAIYQCIAQENNGELRQLSPPILVTHFPPFTFYLESRFFVQQPRTHIGYRVQITREVEGYEPIAFQCELVKIFNGTKPVITWQVMETPGGPIVNYTESSDGENRFLIQYDHIGYFQIHSPTVALDGLQARCVATHPDSPTEVVYSEWAYANITGLSLPQNIDDQPGFDPYSHRPPTVYHVEEGQDTAILPCAKLIGLHDHDPLWVLRVTPQSPETILYFGEILFDASLASEISLFGHTNLQIDVSNGQFMNQEFDCRIQLQNSAEGSAPSRIAGPAPPLLPPNVSNSSYIVSAVIGENEVLTYTIGTSDPILSVWWWKNGVIVPSDHSRYVTTVVGMTATLSITGVEEEDRALFQVMVLTGSRFDFSGEIGNFNLITGVGAAAYVISSTGDVVADEGSSITLEVTAEGYPDIITYTWTKDGTVILGETTDTLTINPVNISDIGEYECTPSNSEGTFNTSVIQVDVKVPSVSYSVLADSSITRDVGPSSIGGYICTPAIPNGEINTSGQLVISGRLDTSDEGIYRCTSTEISGDIVIELVATDIPRPALSHSSLTLSSSPLTSSSSSCVNQLTTSTYILLVTVTASVCPSDSNDISRPALSNSSSTLSSSSPTSTNHISSSSSCVNQLTTNTCAMTAVTGLSSSAAAGISVVITVPITAPITALVTVIVLYLCGSLKHNSKKQSWTPQEYETQAAVKRTTTSGLEMKSNTAYGQVKYTTPTDSIPPATTTVYETIQA